MNFRKTIAILAIPLFVFLVMALLRNPPAPTPRIQADAPASATHRIPSVPGRPSTHLSPDESVGDETVIAPPVRRVLSETWLDAPTKATGRERVRIVEADFKYPMLRLTEFISKDPESGEAKVKVLETSVADHLMVGLKKSLTEKEAEEVFAGYGFELRAYEAGSFALVKLQDFQDANSHEKNIRDLMALEEFVDYAEPDFIVHPLATPDDPEYLSGKLWSLHNPGGVAGTKADADIDAPEGWNVRNDASVVVVAVTDTGINYSHEDLAPNMWTNGLGEHGFDAYEDDNDPMDTTGHGTHCAGTIGARGDNGIGITGVAWKVQLMACRFLGPNGGTTSDAIRVINYARLNGAHIINASWGGGGYSQGLFSAIGACYAADIAFVAAAGNDGRGDASTPHYPSAYNLPNVVSVASTDKNDEISIFSNRGYRNAHIAAPGSSILSCGIEPQDSYRYLSGTSMAAPHVAGALALAKAHFAGESCEQLINRAYSSADAFGFNGDSEGTWGRLNLHNLLTASTRDPFHDFFSSPYVIRGCNFHWCGNNGFATREQNEDMFSPGTGFRSLWFSYVAPADGLVTFRGSGNKGDVSVVAFEGTERFSLRRMADNFKERPRSSSTLNFYVTEGREYRFSLDSRLAASQTMVATLDFRVGNDMFADAFELPPGGNFSIVASNCGATAEAFEKLEPFAWRGRGKSVWWNFTPDFSGRVTITTQGSGHDTVLGVYTGSPKDGFVEIDYNDDRNALDYSSQVGFEATAGTTYRVRVDSYRNESNGLIRLNGFRDGHFSILSQPQSVSARIGDRVALSVAVLSASAPRYQWFQDGKRVHGENRSLMVIDSLTDGQVGAYHCEISNEVETLVSETAFVSEIQRSPKVTWASGNLSVLAGGAAGFSVRVGGSGPFVYTWHRGDNILPGQSSATLFLNPVSEADAGAYTVTIGNQAGSTTHSFALAIVANSLEGLEWRRPGYDNAPITDLKSYANEAYAVAGDTLLRTADGVAWEKSRFPYGFSGRSFAKIGSTRIVHGYNNSGAAAVATSAAGGPWNVQPLTGLGITKPGEFRLTEFAGKLIARFPGGSSSDHTLYSTDGVTWIPCQASDASDNPVPFFGTGQPATDGTTMIIAGADSPVGNQAVYYKTTNGLEWTRMTTNAPGLSSSRSANQAVHVQGAFLLIGTNGVYRSGDGSSWTYASEPGLGSPGDNILATDGISMVSFSRTSQQVSWYDGPGMTGSRSVFPANSQSFTSATFFGGAYIFGTSRGFLGIAADPESVAFPAEKATGLTRIAFRDGFFVASNSTLGVETNLISGDGVTWKTANPLSHPWLAHRGHALGLNWADGSMGGGVVSPTNNPIVTGPTPLNFHNPSAVVMGLDAPLQWIGESPGGDTLAITSLIAPQTGYGLLVRPNGSSVWTRATTPFTLTIQTVNNLRHLAGRWYFLASDNRLYSSADGLTWIVGGTTRNYSLPMERDGVVYAMTTEFSPLKTGIEKSTDGINWTRHAVTGLPGINLVYDFLEFGGSFILSSNKGVHLSPDGLAWASLPLPGTVVGFAKGNGQLVIALSSGGILQTGTPHPGGHAPLVTITSPPQESSHLIGSPVDVRAELSDPPGEPVSYRCYVDGVETASGTGTVASFRFTATKPEGHIIEVVVTDAGGLRNADFIRIRGTSPDPLNKLLDGDSLGSISPGSAVVLNGSFYALGGRALHRSRDGIVWERVEIPSSSRFIYAMAAGNGSLVLQYDNGSLITSTDGIHWISFSPNQAAFGFASSLRFANGLFTAAADKTALFSTDGIRWESSLSNEAGDIAWVAADDGGEMVVAGNTQGGVFSSQNRGASWRPIASVQVGNDGIGIHADGRFVAVAPRGGKSFVSQDGITWDTTLQPLFSPLVGSTMGSPALIHVGGRFFAGGTKRLLYSSQDGSSWQALGIECGKEAIVHAAGRFIAATATGIATSTDATNWTIPVGSPENVTTLSSNGEIIVAIGANGGTWTSVDGIVWTPGLPGRPIFTLPNANTTPSTITRFGGKVLLTGSTGLVAFSEDEAKSWRNGTVDGSNASSSDTYFRTAASGEAAVALSNTGRKLIRTTNGMDWLTVPGLLDYLIADIDTDGTTWMAVARTGEILSSADHGLTWTNTASPLLSAKMIAWFGGKWILVGSTQSASSAPCSIYTMGGDGTLTERAPAGFNNSAGGVAKLAAHGKFLIWASRAVAVFSEDGITWTSTGFNASNAANYSIYASGSGFKALVGSSGVPLQWQAPAAALPWTAIASPHRNVNFGANLGLRAFLFGPGQLLEDTNADFSLEMAGSAPVSVGVGDVLSVPVIIRNTGSASPPAAAWRIEAYLSKDGYFGDLNDIPLGSVPVNVSLPEGGGSVFTTIELEIPERILTGANHLALKLICEDTHPEISISNNQTISLSPFVTIPEWDLALDTVGNGSIDLDFAALSYAHNSRVSLKANAGKGVSFNGWSGDAIGAESEVTVLMNGDKSVIATFSAMASLQIIVQGEGQISGLTDLGSYPLNSTAALTATPAPGWVFTGWAGAAGGNDPNANIVMNSPKTVFAGFAFPIASWKQTVFSPSEQLDPQYSGDDADPDLDGVPNWQEYLNGSDPNSASSNGILQTRLEPGYLSIIFTRVSGPDIGLSLQSQGTRTLDSWETVDFQERVLYTTGGVETVEARLPTAGQNKGFIRMKYER